MRTKLCWIMALVVWAMAGRVLMAQIVYPTGAGYLDAISDCGATGNGTTDDTANIQTCIHRSTQNQGGGIYKNIVYFPSGTYLISSTLLGQSSAGVWSDNITLQGQNSATTTIKMTPGTYTSTSCTVLFIDSTTGTLCPAVIQTGDSNAEWGENAFNNNIRDLTIDTTGNPGVVGIEWQANNSASLRNVIVQGGGMVGVAAYDDASVRNGSGPGPGRVLNLEVNGTYACGIATTSGEVSLTWEHITIVGGPTQAGWCNTQNNEWVRDLAITTTGSIPAITNGSNGSFAVIDSTWTGGGGASAAVLNSGYLYARNITTTGYTSAINGISGNNISEYVSSGATTLFAGSASTSLGLPINETPPLINDNTFANWVSVESEGGVCGADVTAAFQAAVNSGHSTVYFASACGYTLSGTVTVPSGVCRILGFWGVLTGSGSGATIQFNGSSCSYVEFRQFATSASTPNINILNNLTVPLVIRDIMGYGGINYDSVGSNGQTLYIDNYAGPGTVHIESGCTAWARNVDIETNTVPFLYNTGGTLWVLGFTTEGFSTGQGMLAGVGGKTEVIGVLNSSGPSNTLVSVVNGQMSVAAFSSESASPQTLISETRSSTTNTLGPNGLRFGNFVGLYIGYVGSGPPPSPCTSGGPGSGASCIQFTRGFDQSGTQDSTIAATFPAAVTATNLLVVSCMYFDAGVPTITLTDSLSQTYTATTAVTSGSFSLRNFYLASTTGGSDTVTCHFSAAAAYPAILIQEYSGLAKTSVLDASAATNSGTGTIATGGNVTTTQVDMIYGVFYATDSLASVPSGWFIRNQGSPDSDGSADISEISTGTYSSSFTLSASGSWVAGTLAFKVQSSGNTISQAIVVF